MNQTLHYMLDWDFGPTGELKLTAALENGESPNTVCDNSGEAPIHVAARRRRLEAVKILIKFGADIDQKNWHGKTAFAHSVRRGFNEVADFLQENGADISLSEADQLAVAITNGDMDEAKKLLETYPKIIHTGNPEEDRLLADMAGRANSEIVQLLVDRGADLEAVGLDGGTALHQAAWFGQPECTRILVDAGAKLDRFDNDHDSSALGWAVHGARYSGGAAERIDDYFQITKTLLEAGSSLQYPKEYDNCDPPVTQSFFDRLLEDAPGKIKPLFDSYR